MDTENEYKTDSVVQESGTLKREKEEVLFSWSAPVRPFKKRNKEFFTTILSIAFLVGLILFFIEGILPVIVVGALVFLVYVFSTVEPETVEHKITNLGIDFAGTKKEWPDLKRFWFTQRFGIDLLKVEAKEGLTRIEMVIDSGDKDRIEKLLEKHLPYEEAAPNFLDKAAIWLSKKVPLEG